MTIVRVFVWLFFDVLMWFGAKRNAAQTLLVENCSVEFLNRGKISFCIIS